jgi:hypothetical protein
MIGCEQTEPVALMDVELHDRLREKLVLPSEPEGAISLHDLYDQLASSDADETGSSQETTDKLYVVVGRVGALDDSDNPDDPQARWSHNFAEFKLLDPAGESVSADAESTVAEGEHDPNVEGEAAAETDHHEHAGHDHSDPDHECPFCSAEGPGIQTIVRFLDDQGEVIPVDARVLFQLDGDDLVVVRGHARLEPGSIVIDGTGLHVRR